MHWLLAALLLVGAVDLSTSIGVSVNTSTSNLDEAAGSASVPGKGYVSETNVGPNPNQISPPKQVPPAGGGGGGGIVIVSNSHVLNGSQVNKVDTIVEAFKTTRRAWMPNQGHRPSQGVEIPNIINIIPPMPPLPPPVLFPPGFPNGRSSDVSNVSSTMSRPKKPSE